MLERKGQVCQDLIQQEIIHLNSHDETGSNAPRSTLVLQRLTHFPEVNETVDIYTERSRCAAPSSLFCPLFPLLRSLVLVLVRDELSVVWLS